MLCFYFLREFRKKVRRSSRPPCLIHTSSSVFAPPRQSPEMAKRCRNSWSWSDLPDEILKIIAGECITDVSRFRAVCKSWRCSLPSKRLLFPVNVLIEPLHENEEEISIYLTEGSVVYHVAPPSPTKVSSNDPTSTTRGWLVKVKAGESGIRTQMLNPLNSFNIKEIPESFPKVLNLLDFRVSELVRAYGLHDGRKDLRGCRVAVSSSRDCPTLMFLRKGILYHGNLDIGHNPMKCKALKNDLISRNDYYFEDVIFHEGKFYAVSQNHETAVVDSSFSEVTMIKHPLRAPPPWPHGPYQKYLVKSLKELLLVYKSLIRKQDSPGLGIEVKIKVFKLNAVEKQWDKIKSLDDRILFLGEDCCFSVSARDFPGCEGNHIYFYDRSFTQYCRYYSSTRMFSEIGVLNFDGESLLPLSPLSYYRSRANIFWPLLP